MKKETKKTAQKPVKQRNKYTADQKETAQRYYLMGLNMQDISKLLGNCSVRTLEKWQLAGKWTELKQPKAIKTRAKELHESGRTYDQIAEILQISRVTVWRYIKSVKQTKEV